MDGAQKVKLALDETRMLVLGAQVLLGFQLRSTFHEQFDAIPPQSRFLDAVALLLMSLVVGLLIAPAIYHRVVEDGDATARIQRFLGLLMAAALIPFALAIGINVFVAMERIVASESAARGSRQRPPPCGSGSGSNSSRAGASMGRSRT
jgi:hypothetical protein